MTRSNWRKLSSLKRAPITRGIAHVVKPVHRYEETEASGKQLVAKCARDARNDDGIKSQIRDGKEKKVIANKSVVLDESIVGIVNNVETS